MKGELVLHDLKWKSIGWRLLAVGEQQRHQCCQRDPIHGLGCRHVSRRSHVSRLSPMRLSTRVYILHHPVRYTQVDQKTLNALEEASRIAKKSSFQILIQRHALGRIISPALF